MKIILNNFKGFKFAKHSFECQNIDFPSVGKQKKRWAAAWLP